MHKSRSKWNCEDCSQNTSQMREHYFIHTTLWLSVHPNECGMLCVGCLESRLGRNLVPADFPSVHINNPKKYSMSDRLRSRIGAK